MIKGIAKTKHFQAFEILTTLQGAEGNNETGLQGAFHHLAQQSGEYWMPEMLVKFNEVVT